jgi:NnrU protein
MSMIYLMAGLLLFLGVHSTRVFADGWRTRTRARLGEKPFKGLYSLLSLAGFVLLVWGYGVARQQPVVLWSPPTGMRHLAALLTLVSFVLLAAAQVPGNHIKARAVRQFSGVGDCAVCGVAPARSPRAHGVCAGNHRCDRDHGGGRCCDLGRVCVLAAPGADRRRAF